MATSSAQHTLPPRVRSTRVSFRNHLINSVNEAYSAECQQLVEAWANYQRATLEDAAGFAAEDMAVAFDSVTGLPLDDLAVVMPPDDCFPEAVYTSMPSISDLRAQSMLRMKVHQAFKESLVELHGKWEHHINAINASRYLQSVDRPPATPTDLVARLRHYTKWDLRKWNHWMRMPPYAFEDILELIEDDAIFHNNSH
ncbi:hypothetical protein DAEQUDRAFT_570485 [Daedalea quercina L-15889]|uniref:Uncharacterized protein n=1 Tax=Daedalea quercina L-15889 TaxID=1314783 RepID=A0A165LWX5_9APHY|nr:hypothetical protein DAEQUDRAFT_570485 [Daedalea quercina L-15889]